ncbi:MAG: LDCC motif putative metal-binding protein [Bacillota bacterium]
MMKKLMKKISQFIEKLAKANEDAYGSDRLDCCSLNKREKS